MRENIEKRSRDTNKAFEKLRKINESNKSQEPEPESYHIKEANVVYEGYTNT